MHEPDNQQPMGPYDLRPEEPFYLVGWILWLIAGGYFVYRGLTEARSLFVVCGSAAMLLAAIQAAVIVVTPLRPWRKLVRTILMVLVVLFLIVIYALDLV